MADISKTAGDGDSICVMIRVRPPIVDTSEDICLEVENNQKSVRMHSKPESKLFTFDQVADENVSQETIFTSVGKRVVESCMSGYNGTIFAYGQTGSGKTFTMLGPSEDSDNFQHQMRGVIPRSFEYLFHLIKREQELHGEKIQFLCKCSFLEIYNEQIYDLLDTASAVLQLREDIKRGVFVDGQIEETVSNAVEAYQVLSTGWINRTVASTSMNRESSRSHAVFTVVIESKENKNGVWSIRKCYLNLVDLAGSERQKDTKTSGARLKEAGKINKSLSVLGNVIMALVDIAHGKARHIPYRDSKLSFLLRDSLGGNAKTHMIACVHPGSRSFGESLSTLMFARRAKMIKNKAVVNEDTQGSIMHLQAEIRRLKEMLSNSGICSSPSPLVSSDQSNDQDSMEGKWKQYFIEAMYLREKEATARQACENEIKQLRDARDKTNRKNQMILKFRDAAVQRIEKSFKDKSALTPDDKDAIIQSQREEIKQWEEKYNSHPDVKSYKMAYERLLNEVKQLKGQDSVKQINKQKANELIKLYEDTLALKEGEAERPSRQTPQNLEDNRMSERQKAQMSSLESETERLRGELNLLSEKLQKSEAELKAAKVSREKAEELLECHQVRNQVERENAEERHMDTIKSLTPKKACVKWQLRNRPVVVQMPGTPVPAFSLDESRVENTDELITEEGTPSEYSEERVQGLLEELEKASKDTLDAKSQLDTKDKYILELVEGKSLMESQKDQVNKELRKLKEDIESSKKLYEETIEELCKQLDKSRVEIQYLNEEKKEMELLSRHSEKKLKEIGYERDTYFKYTERNNILESDLMKLETELSRLKRSEEEGCEQIEMIKEQLETSQATVSYQEDQLLEKEDSIRTLKNHVNQLEVNLESISQQLVEEELKRSDLTAQLQDKGDKEQQLIEAMQEAEFMNQEVKKKQSAIQQLQEQTTSLQASLKELNQKYESVQKAEAEKIVHINKITASIAELRAKLQASEQALHNEKKHSEDLGQERDFLKDQNAKLEQTEEALKKEIKALEDEDCVKKAEYEKALSKLQEQLDDVNEEKESHYMELQSSQIFNQELLESERKLLGDMERFENENQSLTKELQVCETKLDELRKEKIMEKDAEVAKYMDENLSLCTRLKEKESRYEKLNNAFDELSKSHKFQTNENWKLTTHSSALEQQCHELDVKCADLRAVLHKAQFEEKELLDQLVDIELQSSLAEQDAMHAMAEKLRLQQECDKLASENTLIQDRFDAQIASLAESEEEEKRLKQEISKKQEELYDMTSKIESLEQNENDLRKRCSEQATKIEELQESAAALVGHHNPKQKIHHIDKLKTEICETNQKVLKLEMENQKLKAELIRVKKNPGSSGTPLKVSLGANAITPSRNPMTQHSKPMAVSSTSDQEHNEVQTHGQEPIELHTQELHSINGFSLEQKACDNAKENVAPTV